jgi:hypothetical protein
VARPAEALTAEASSEASWAVASGVALAREPAASALAVPVRAPGTVVSARAV